MDINVTFSIKAQDYNEFKQGSVVRLHDITSNVPEGLLTIPKLNITLPDEYILITKKLDTATSAVYVYVQLKNVPRE